MKIAIMQPYFFPYIGYFSLIKNTDRFILFDTVQFIYHGWIARNRILKPENGWQYINVPLQKHSREIKIKDVAIKDDLQWRERIIAQLQHYKKSAPYFSTVMSLLNDVLFQEYPGIVSVNQATLKAVCDYLEIKTSIETFSRMDLKVDDAAEPDEWALNICKAMDGVTEYWNPPGGIQLFDRSKYESDKIKLVFQKVQLSEYDQGRLAHEAGLSIIDVMMFNGVSEINKMLDDYELL